MSETIKEVLSVEENQKFYGDTDMNTAAEHLTESSEVILWWNIDLLD